MTRTNAFIDDTQANFRNQGASIRNLEHQVGEISKLLTERAQGALPSNTERNPREKAKAITLRSGKELEKSKEASKQAIEEDTSVSKDQPATTTIEQPLPKPSSNACSTILQRKLPPKLKDPGSFTIPCTIGDFEFDKVLCDLGESINLMPLSIFRKLGLGEVKPTTVYL
ncbi:hypothetical protein UlMin_034918 [Ulmus minor]